MTRGDKPARTEKFPLCSLFRIGYVSFVVDPRGYILLKPGIFSMAHATSAVFFDVCKDTETYIMVKCDRIVSE